MFCDSEDLPSSVDNISDSICVVVYETQMHSPNHTRLSIAVFYITTCKLFLWNMAYPGVNTDKVNYQPFQLHTRTNHRPQVFQVTLIPH